MCSPKSPDTSAQQAEAARQSQVQEAEYNAQLAAQQAEWQTERDDAERRYQQQLQMQQDEIAREAAQSAATAKADADAKQKAIDDQAAVTARGRDYSDYRDQQIQGATGAVNDAFSQFNPAYFSDYASKFVAANRVDADNQYDRSTRSMKYKLADNANLNSSAATDAFGELDQDHNSAINKITDAGNQAAASYSNQVAQQKNADLNGLLTLGNDAAPDFQTDADASAAKDKFGAAILAMGNNLRSTIPLAA